MQEKKISTKPLQDYIFISKYSRTQDGTKETWEDSVKRVMKDTHWKFYENKGINMDAFRPYWLEAYNAYLNNYAIGAQRVLQWGGEQLVKHQFKTYNCSSSYANRIKFFQELFYILLCGAGAGYSVQKVHTNMLPEIRGTKSKKYEYIISDDIEGWASSTGALIESHFYNTEKPEFYYGKIRSKGSFISGGFKAPGPEPLEKCHQKVDSILTKAKGRKLTPFEIHRISCIIADAVISGGVRRSALLVLFDADDEEMMTCKTGNWFYQYPELARANNSAVILPNTPKETYEKCFSYVEQYGEPGFAFLNNPWQCFNPCFEVGMMPMLFSNEDWTLKDFIDYLKKESPTTVEKMKDHVHFGWSTCNLSEVNGVKIKTEDELYKAVRAAAILGTIQAGYDSFPFLGPVTEKIVQRDALIGVSMNSMASNPDLFFNPRIQKKMAEVVKQVNEEVAEVLEINPAARTTVIKPSGNSSQMQGGAPGIHGFKSPKYIRNVQANETEQSAIEYRKVNPNAVEKSVWNNNDLILSFPIEVPIDNTMFIDDLTAIDFLENVKLTQQHWVLEGTNEHHPSYKIDPTLSHNVSNTCTVNFSKENYEGKAVMEYLWENRKYFTGVSLLPKSGDVDYPQAPYQTVLDPIELAEEYGTAAILGSGLVVDGLHEFGDLWVATDTAMGKGLNLDITTDDLADLIGENLKEDDDNRLKFEFKIDGVMITDINAILGYMYQKVERKKEWVGRFKRFAKKYLKGDEQKTADCLKRISLYHKWVHLVKSKPVDWQDIEWEDPLKYAGDEAAQNCAGGACLL